MMDDHNGKVNIITEKTQMPDWEAALKRVTSRARNDTEILYYYCIEMCRILKPDGFWSSPEPSPLSVNQIRNAFELVKKHPLYKGQSLITRTPDGQRVALVNGRISEAEDDQGWTLPPLRS